MATVGIVDSGVANLASVRNMFVRLELDAITAAEPGDLRCCTHVVLPGVGAFGAAMHRLRDRGFDTVVRQHVGSGRPLLAICLGMQLLCDRSDETPDEVGLGVVSGRLRRLPSSVPVPHLGWNRVRPGASMRWVSEGHAAFANSYALADRPPSARVAWTTHGTRFVSAIEQGSLLACQFHPELSGPWGAAVVERWLQGATGVPTSAPSPNGPEYSMRLIPCLDVRDGRVVKGVRFRDLRDIGDPAAHAMRYESEGADEIVLLDIAASPEERETQVSVVRAVAEALSIPLTVGGGVRGVGDAGCLLAAGADKVAVNTAAVRRPGLIGELAESFGTQCVVLAIDARRTGPTWEVLVNGGREPAGRDAVTWACQGVASGAGELLVTSWDRDGTRQGCDVGLVGAVSRAAPVPVVASGGIGGPSHVAEAFDAGAAAVLAASVFHDADLTVDELKSFLAARGIPVRR